MMSVPSETCSSVESLVERRRPPADDSELRPLGLKPPDSPVAGLPKAATKPLVLFVEPTNLALLLKEFVECPLDCRDRVAALDASLGLHALRSDVGLPKNQIDCCTRNIEIFFDRR
jgi:hypothetical protein